MCGRFFGRAHGTTDELPVDYLELAQIQVDRVGVSRSLPQLPGLSGTRLRILAEGIAEAEALEEGTFRRVELGAVGVEGLGLDGEGDLADRSTHIWVPIRILPCQGRRPGQSLRIAEPIGRQQSGLAGVPLSPQAAGSASSYSTGGMTSGFTDLGMVVGLNLPPGTA